MLSCFQRPAQIPLIYRGSSPIYNRSVARGWESKAVEQQLEAREAEPASGSVLSPEEISRRKRRETLRLARRQVLQQLELARHPRHRQMLESALADLDSQLARET